MSFSHEFIIGLNLSFVPTVHEDSFVFIFASILSQGTLLCKIAGVDIFFWDELSVWPLGLLNKDGWIDCHTLDVREDPFGDIQRHTANLLVADVSLPFVKRRFFMGIATNFNLPIGAD